MKIATDIVIDKPIAVVWDVVGTQFGNAHVWASALLHTRGHGEKISEQVAASRTCEVRGMGRVQEKLLEFDPLGYSLTYKGVDGFPFFVGSAVNRWRLVAEGTGTHVYSDVEVITKGLTGTLMSSMMKMQMSGLMRTTLEDLKFYVESGRPHPRKQKTLAAAQKLARA